MDHKSRKMSTSIEDADGNTFAEVIDLIRPEDIGEEHSDWKSSGVYQGPDRKEYVKRLLDKRLSKKKKKEGKKMDEQSNLGEGKKKGLWDNIHAKRKRGEKPAKPGDKDYPETLDIGEGMKTARKNVGADKCWDGYKAKGTKKKDGKEVPNCVKEGKKTFSQFCAEAEEKRVTSIDEGLPVAAGLAAGGKLLMKGLTSTAAKRAIGGAAARFVAGSSKGSTPQNKTKKEEFELAEAKDKRYCKLCKKKETRDECSYGKKAWDKYSVLDESAWQRKEGKNKAGGLNEKGRKSYERENPGSDLKAPVTKDPSKLDPDSKSAKRRKSFCARMGGMPGPMKDEKGRPTRKALSLRKWNC